MSLLDKSSRNKGFTLIEVLIALFILALLLVPLFRVMILSYNTVEEEKTNTEERDNFRFFSTFLIEDLMFADNVQVTNKDSKTILSYTTKAGKAEQVYFDEKEGIFIRRNGEFDKVVEAEQYEEGYGMVRIEEGIVKFNVYSRTLNILFVTNVHPRPGGMM